MYYDHSCFLYENKTCQFFKIFRCLKVISYIFGVMIRQSKLLQCWIYIVHASNFLSKFKAVKLKRDV